MGENIGAAARIMLNFGLTDLRLVAPRDGWPNEAAISNGAGAIEKMDVLVFPGLQEAIADLQFVLATTARPRDMVKPVFTPPDAMAEIAIRSAQGQKTGFVFGRERSGLENDDVALCSGIVSFPVNADFASVNLAQAVAVIAYECSKLSTSGAPAQPDIIPAPRESLKNFLSRLEDELEATEFFRSPEMKPTMVRNIRNMFTRGDLTEQEVRTLQGIVTALKQGK